MFSRNHIPLLLTVIVFAGVANGQKDSTWCGAMEVLERLKREDPTLELRMQQIESDIQQWISTGGGLRQGLGKRRLDRITPPPLGPLDFFVVDPRNIPVVVHVVHNTAAQNISDSQILSQINVLNEDYRRMAGTRGFNGDAVSADSEIEFRLAEIDPDGNATNGITRTSTSETSFTSDDDVKYTSLGSHDTWDASEYLNILVCNLAGGLLGYAQFPGGPDATDGIVVDFEAFGDSVGTNVAPYHLGRTTSHEIGHYLNLYHTFQGGCTNSNCSTQGDRVCDTPPVASPTLGCPSSRNSCSTDNPDLPDQTENYMDYTDDACMNLFTDDQSTRMNATIDVARSSLITSAALVSTAFILFGDHDEIYSYNGSDSIVVKGSSPYAPWVVQNTGDVVLRAGGTIILAEGFHAKAGSDFRAYVDAGLGKVIASGIAIGEPEKNNPGIPAVYSLSPAFPNPFNPTTTIRFGLPEDAAARLVVYDLLGREVARLLERSLEAGYHSVVWNGNNAAGAELASGLYIARLTTPGFTKSIKMVLLK